MGLLHGDNFRTMNFAPLFIELAGVIEKRPLVLLRNFKKLVQQLIYMGVGSRSDER